MLLREIIYHRRVASVGVIMFVGTCARTNCQRYARDSCHVAYYTLFLSGNPAKQIK